MSGGYSLEVTDGRTYHFHRRGPAPVESVGPGHTTRLGLGLTFSYMLLPSLVRLMDGWMDDEGVGDSFCLRYGVIILILFTEKLII